MRYLFGIDRYGWQMRLISGVKLSRGALYPGALAARVEAADGFPDRDVLVR